MDRYLEDSIRTDLAHKMVFVGGPRQVGKTTLARKIEGDKGGYLSWDIPAHRAAILKRALPDAALWVFDEFHKYRRWRNYLKGLYDEFHPRRHVLVTGSARLDYYRHGGDSLQGRYYYVRLHPFSFAEIGASSEQDLMALMRLGGFPEPFTQGSEKRAARWSLAYRDRLIREDVASLENIRDLGSMELLMLSLPERVGSPLSVNALREDLSLNHQTVSRWLDVFERLYAIFRIPPFGSPKLRAVKKERKHYHVDWTLVPQEGPRFENLVAAHILKWIHFVHDTEGRALELRYFRDHDRREVDFVIVEGRKPIQFIECKLSTGPVAPALRYLVERFPQCEAYQIHLHGNSARIAEHGIRLWPAKRYLATLC